MRTFVGGVGNGGGVHQSTGWFWYGLRFKGILWKDSEDQEGDGEGHLRLFGPQPEPIPAEPYTSEEARTYQLSVATITFSVLLFVGAFCTCLWWGMKCCRWIRRGGFLRKGPLCASEIPNFFVKDEYLIHDDVEESIGHFPQSRIDSCYGVANGKPGINNFRSGISVVNNGSNKDNPDSSGHNDSLDFQNIDKMRTV